MWSFAWWKSDVYLIAVEIGGIAKISLHLRTGEFNFSYVHEYFAANRDLVGGSSRHMEQWVRPPAGDDGFTLPLRLFVANEALKTDLELPTAKAIHWVAPRPGRAVGFTWLLTPAAVGTNPFPHPDLDVIARVELPAHPEAIWFFVHHIESERVSEAAFRSAREFRDQAPDVELHHRQRLLGLQNPEPSTGARIFMEVPVPAV